MGTTELRIAGFGGQGVILAGMVIGNAATLHDGKFVTLTQSFGPEARGSTCSVQLIVSTEPILYPYLTQPDILVVLSKEAHTRFGSDLKPGGMLLYEEDLIHLDNTTQGIRHFGISATRFAEELGRKLVLNMVMVGFVTALTGLASPEAVRKAIGASVPRGTEQLNLAAFAKGHAYGQTLQVDALSPA
ncbi:MAG: 2-oxoacid:acceptor oxidoreductase family protein [Terriglobia bacterium]|jgi:2-oxoglutarate ferredoxin oxidoreductase subunit gamma